MIILIIFILNLLWFYYYYYYYYYYLHGFCSFFVFPSRNYKLFSHEWICGLDKKPLMMITFNIFKTSMTMFNLGNIWSCDNDWFLKYFLFKNILKQYLKKITPPMAKRWLSHEVSCFINISLNLGCFDNGWMCILSHLPFWSMLIVSVLEAFSFLFYS